MARIELSNEKYRAAFGHDHALGWFLDIIPNETGAGFDADTPMVFSQDTLFDGLTSTKVKAQLTAHGFTLADIEQGWYDHAKNDF